MTKRLHIE